MDKKNHTREAQLRAISIHEKRLECAQIVNSGTAEVKEGLGSFYERGSHRTSIEIEMTAAPESQEIKYRPDGSIDTAHYMKIGREQRSEQAHNLVNGTSAKSKQYSFRVWPFF